MLFPACRADPLVRKLEFVLFLPRLWELMLARLFELTLFRGLLVLFVFREGGLVVLLMLWERISDFSLFVYFLLKRSEYSSHSVRLCFDITVLGCDCWFAELLPPPRWCDLFWSSELLRLLRFLVEPFFLIALSVSTDS